MKHFVKKKALVFVILLLPLTLLISCGKEIKFEEVKAAENAPLNNSETIEKFNMRFNPKANSSIIIELSSGSKFRASQLDPSQTAAILSILSVENLLFDRVNEEFLIK